MIEIKNLNRSFGSLRAVNDISFCINSGSITGFLGPNGAGKTTTLRMMVGYLQPDSGTISIDGISIFENPILTSAKIGYLPEHNPLYEDMLVMEILKYVADLRNMPTRTFTERQNFVVSNCGLKQVLTQRIGTLSKGYKQRVGLATAMLHDPEILILDEPTSGLDPNQIIEIRELIRTLGKEKTVILSSHIMQEVQALCDRVIIINKGQIVVDDEIGSLNSYLDDYSVLYLELDGNNIDMSEFISLYPDVEQLSYSNNDSHCQFQFRISQNKDIVPDLSRFVREKGWLIISLYTKERSLEEIFHNLTGVEFEPQVKHLEQLDAKESSHLENSREDEA